MRNPDRIEPFLEKLGKIWKENCPDWRFGQFVENIIKPYDMFYVEEDEMIKHIEELFKMRKKENN